MKIISTSLVVVLLASPTFAQEITGGSLAVEGLGFSEGDNSTSVNYQGAIEYGINRNWSIAADVASYDHSLLSGDGGNLTLHLMYHLSEDATVGVFRSADALDIDGQAFGEGLTGIEAGYEMGQFEGEGFVGFYDSEGDESLVSLSGGTLFGASGGYAFNDSITATAKVGLLNSDVVEVTSFSAGAEYAFDVGPILYAELGKVNTDNLDSTFVGLGAKINFGAERGTTFDIRSAFEGVKFGF